MGGIELFDLLRRLLPNERFFYFADTRNNPYGEKTPEIIAGYLDSILRGFCLRGAKLILIACNTASAVWLDLDRSHPLKEFMRREGVDVVPMLHPQVFAELVPSPPKRLLVAATPLTVASGHYLRLARRYLPETETVQLSAPQWVRAVENLASADERRAVVEKVLAEVGDHPDALLLGCTHFSRLDAELRESLGHSCRIVNPVHALAHFVAGYLDVRGLAEAEPSPEREDAPVLFTNGDPELLERHLAAGETTAEFRVRLLDVRDELAGKRIDIVGLGMTGQSLFRHVMARGALRVILRDQGKSIEELQRISQDRLGADDLRQGDAYLKGLEHSDLILRSPGVPGDLPEIAKAREKNVPVLSDIELFLQEARGDIGIVTGTNGKTTTTLLLHEFFRRDRPGNSMLIGNVGRPVLDRLDETRPDSRIALELSSFQIETLNRARANVAVFLNLTPDHLDRHGDFAGYAEAKGRLLTLLDDSSYVVYNFEDPEVVNRILPMGTQARTLPFSTRRVLPYGAMLDGSDLVLKHPDREPFVIANYLEKMMFSGDHNMENMLASLLAAWLIGVKPAVLEEVALSFSGVEYRIEPFAMRRGAVFFDDSKGTNPDASIKALEMLGSAGFRRIRLISGGDNKGVSLDGVAAECQKFVAKAYIFGGLAEEFSLSLKTYGVPFEIFPDLATATLAAAKKAKVMEAVCFSAVGASPAGTKYYQRGDEFKRRILELGDTEVPPRREDGLWLEDPLAKKH